MITNDRQYKIAKSQIVNFEHSLDDLLKAKSAPKNVHPKIADAYRNAIESQLQDLISQVNEYENLKSGRIVVTEVKKFSDLSTLLIKARIANGLTQAELARALGMKEQQIQRYESELYNSASLKTLYKIADTLNVTLNGEAELKLLKHHETVLEDLNVTNYPFKEMFKRNWFRGFKGSLNEALQRAPELIFKLYDSAGFNLKYSLTKKSIRSGGTLNEDALNAWYAHVVIKAKEQKLNVEFNRATINDQWLKNLAKLSREHNGPERAAVYLKDSGIKFIIEPQLEGTYLDGAALLLENNAPVIALTLRYDRLDNFWFVLFHEIAHVILHLNDDIDAIFDDLDVKNDGIENEADNYALNALIPNEVWRKSLVRFSPSNETIINQAEKLGVHPALVAGRIRRETSKYHLFNDLVGQGQVRPNFIDQFIN